MNSEECHYLLRSRLPSAITVVIVIYKHNSCNKSFKYTFPFVAKINFTFSLIIRIRPVFKCKCSNAGFIQATFWGWGTSAVGLRELYDINFDWSRTTCKPRSLPVYDQPIPSPLLFLILINILCIKYSMHDVIFVRLKQSLSMVF